MINIVDYIPYGREQAIKRRRLCELTGMRDREMRGAIEKAQMNGEVIINLQDGNGYFRPLIPGEENLVQLWLKAERGRFWAAAIKMENAERLLGEI